jgi:hypothetical protein
VVPDQATAAAEKAAQRAIQAAEADAFQAKQELGAAKKALWVKEGEQARLL